MVSPFRLMMIAVALLAGLWQSGPVAAAERVLVFAAASMKDAMETAGAAWTARSGVPVIVSAAASSTLAKQVAAGAPADLYVSADRAWMDWLAERDAIDAASVVVIAGNGLVIAAPPGEAVGPRALLSRGRFAMGDPDHVPAGRYTRQALEAIGLWPQLQARAVRGENVRVALELVRRGEVAAAIVYRSDLKLAPDLVAAHSFDGALHERIVYPVALTRKSGAPARRFLDFLSGPETRAILLGAGFAPPPEPATQ